MYVDGRLERPVYGTANPWDVVDKNGNLLLWIHVVARLIPFFVLALRCST